MRPYRYETHRSPLMPRPKSYDRDAAVEKACHAFWAHGYQALGVRELEQLTGLNQFAIRSEFGGKEGLYLEALDYYATAAITTAMAPLKTGGLAEVITFMRSLTRAGSMTSSAFGCLIVNTGIENTRVGSDKLAYAVQAYWDTLGDHLEHALNTACQRNELPAGFDVAGTAQGLVAAVMGVHAKNRTAGSQHGGQALVDFICASLEQQSVA